MDSTQITTGSPAPADTTLGGIISAAATELGLHEHAAGRTDTPMASRLIRTGAAIEQLLSIALLARAITAPGGTRDPLLLADLVKALGMAEPVLANEHYTRLALDAQRAAA